MKQIVVATRNQGKVKEFAEMLADLQLNWLSLADVAADEEVEETGTTFVANALLKAEAYAKMSHSYVLADDSGLEVDALDGAPGIYTARYGGAGLTHQERYEKLLNELKGVPWEKRTARFRCVIALAGPTGVIAAAGGICEGMIYERAVGENGFGYDPVFYLPQYEKTVAQLPAEVKHLISHRGQAMRRIESTLRKILKEG